MTDTNLNQKYCVKCGRKASVSTCDGCQSSFCSRHTIQHRQELNYQLETIMEDHDALRQNFERPSQEFFFLQKIDKWERDSIKKIKIAAELARTDVQQLMDKSKRRLAKETRDIAYELNSAYKTDDFSEKDLLRWTKVLNDLRLEVKSSHAVELMEDARDPIFPVIVTRNKFQTLHKNITPRRDPANPTTDEYFFQAQSSASIENGGLIIKHTGPDVDYAHILGKRLYFKGRHTTRFKILRCSLPYIIFFGCISADAIKSGVNYRSSLAVGWFGYNEIYQHGDWSNNIEKHGYDSNEIQENDILRLTFDCSERHIELFHERLSKTLILRVDLEKAPLPWRILVVLVHQDDAVKILSER